MKKKLVSIMLVAAMALSVVACGSSKGNSAKTDGTEAMASSVSKTPDNQISINLASEPQSIDPALNSAVDGGCMIVNSFAGLYTYDKDGKLIPQLASDMPEVSDDETVYTVKMIKSQWSNGEEVTANDFVYSWNRAADEKTVDVPVVGINFPAGKVLRTFPSKVQVTFQVGLRHFKDVSSDDFFIGVTYEDVLRTQGDKLPLVVKGSPDFVSHVRVVPSSVDYLIEQQTVEED